MIALDRKGYSLVEMLVVIAIIGVLLSVAMPYWAKYRQNSNLRTAARAVAADIFAMKQRSAGEMINYRITFDQNGNSYSMINTSTGNTVQTRNISDFGEGITITAVTFGSSRINFETRGTASPGAVTLKNSKDSTATVTVSINGRTHVDFSFH